MTSDPGIVRNGSASPHQPVGSSLPHVDEVKSSHLRYIYVLTEDVIFLSIVFIVEMQLIDDSFICAGVGALGKWFRPWINSSNTFYSLYVLAIVEFLAGLCNMQYVVILPILNLR